MSCRGKSCNVALSVSSHAFLWREGTGKGATSVQHVAKVWGSLYRGNVFTITLLKVRFFELQRLEKIT